MRLMLTAPALAQTIPMPPEFVGWWGIVCHTWDTGCDVRTHPGFVLPLAIEITADVAEGKTVFVYAVYPDPWGRPNYYEVVFTDPKKHVPVAPTTAYDPQET